MQLFQLSLFALTNMNRTLNWPAGMYVFDNKSHWCCRCLKVVGGPVVTQGRGGVDEGYYVDDICIGEEDQRWRTQLTESICMTALLGSSVTDDGV